MTKKKRSLRNEKIKAKRASYTEEQRKERLRIRRENRKPRETAPGHSQRLKRGDDKEKPKTGEVGPRQTAQVGHGYRRRKKNKTGK